MPAARCRSERDGDRTLTGQLMLDLLLRAGARDPQLADRLRPAIWLVLLVHLMSGAQPRSGPAPRAARPAPVRLPRRSLPPHSSVTGRRPRG